MQRWWSNCPRVATIPSQECARPQVMGFEQANAGESPFATAGWKTLALFTNFYAPRPGDSSSHPSRKPTYVKFGSDFRAADTSGYLLLNSRGGPSLPR